MRRARRHPVGVVLLSVATLIVAALIVAVALTAGGRGRGEPDLGTFAGYVVPGHDVRSIQGSWVAPRVRPGRGAGSASVWIGAEAPGRFPQSPFIQVGIVAGRDAAGGSWEYGFWTDTDHGFVPQRLSVAIAPGDRLRAGLVLADGHWQAVLIDASTGRSAVIDTGQETAASFNEAQWFQEDPARDALTQHPRPVPYSQTSTVRFTQLRVDGAAPAAAHAISQWMSLPGSDLAPTPLAGDAFSVIARRLSPAAARYVRLAMPEDEAENAFLDALAVWVHGGSAGAIDGPLHRVVTELRRVSAGVEAPGWPESSAAARRAVATTGVRVAASLRPPPTATPAARRAFERRVAQSLLPVGLAGRALRRVLGAPESVPTYR